MNPTVGRVNIDVRANVTGFQDSVQRQLASVGAMARKAGAKISVDTQDGFIDGFKAFDPLRNFTDKFKRDIFSARDSLQQLIRAGFFIGPLVTSIAAALGALGSAIVSLVAVIGAAVPSLFAFANALSSVLQAALTVSQAFRGVGEAFRLGVQAEEGVDNSRAIEAALRRVEQARIRLRNIINREQPERLAEARERAVQAERSAANALRSSESALRSYNEAQRRTLEALDNLNEARETARERIQQLRFETEGAAISEKQARLSFERARDALQRVQDLPPNSRARQEAELAFAQADLNLRRAIDRNADLKEEEAEATRAGVEGSREVLEAKRAIEQATQNEADAQYRAAEAILEAAEARERANKAAEDAAAGGRVQQEINAQIAEAREQLKDALRDLEETQSGGDAANRFKDALEELAPAARDFVLYLIEIRKEFNILRDSAATGFFPLLTQAVEMFRGRLEDLAPLFQSTGESAGKVAVNIAEAFTGAEEFAKVEQIWGNNNYLLESFGRSAGNIIRALQNLLLAADPVARKFADWIELLTSNWATNTGSDIDGLTEKFNRAGEVAGRLGTIIRGWFDIFGELTEIIMAPGGAGEELLNWFDSANEGILAFLQAGSPDGGDGSLVEYFRQGTENGLTLLSIISDIIKILFDLGASPAFETFLGSVQTAVGNFGKMGDEIDGALPAFGRFLENFSLLLLNFTEGEQIETFFRVINEAIMGINRLFENDTFRAVLLFLGQIKAVSIAFSTLFRIAKFFTFAVIGSFLAPFKAISDLSQAVGGFGAKMTKMAGKSGASGAVGKIGLAFIKLGINIGKIATGPVGMVVAAIIGMALYLRNLYTRSEEFKKSWDEFFEKIRPAIERFQESWTKVKIIFERVWEALKGFFGSLRSGADSSTMGFFDYFGDTLALVFDLVSGLVSTIVDFFYILTGGSRDAKKSTEDVSGGFSALWDVVGPILGLFLEGVIGIINFILELIATLTGLRDEGTDLAYYWGEAFTDLINGVKRTFGLVVAIVIGGIAELGNKAVNSVIWLINKVLEAWNFLIDLMGDSAPDWMRRARLIQEVRLDPRFTIAGIYSGFLDDLVNPNARNRVMSRSARGSGSSFSGATFMSSGGIVPAVRGGMLAVIGEGGRSERVEPLDSNGLSERDKAMINYLSGGGRGTTINVYPSQGMDERELANLVSRRLAYELRAGAV